MKPLWTFPLLFTLILALGCGGDDAKSGDGESENPPDLTPPDGGQAGGGQAGGGQQAMNPDGGGGGDPGLGGGDPGLGGGDPGLGGGDPGLGGGDPGLGGTSQQQQPTFDPSLPAGKKQVWTKAKLEADSRGKSAADLIKYFGKPAHFKQQGAIIIYIYDKMYVKIKNMKYSQVSFAIQPDGKGNGKVIAIGIVPNSGTRIQGMGGPGGIPGDGLGEPGLGGEGGPQINPGPGGR